MTPQGWLQLGAYVVVIALLARPVGAWLHRVFETDDRPFPSVLGRAERFLLRLCGCNAGAEQDWKSYAASLLAFSVVSIVLTHAVLAAQGPLPLNPRGFPGMSHDLALNTAVSFVTNTNWQSYSGETTLGHLAQATVLTWQNFVSAAAGLGVALALARGLTRRGGDGPATIGSFPADVVRGVVYVLLPGCLVYALLLAACGVPQTFDGAATASTLEGAAQTIALGPVASQEAVKMLGTNGGGFFNANSAHPFENPTPFTNFVQMVSIFAIPAGLTWTWGKMAGDARQGRALLVAMAAMFVAGAVACSLAESGPNAAVAAAGIDQPAGNLEGKETRFGVPATALFATITTDASCGAVNGMHDSFTPLGGLVPLVNVQLGEVVFGGVGAGLYGILVYVVLAVFLAGLMVGRTPELLGKKIGAPEMKLVAVYVLVFAVFVLVPAAWAAVVPSGVAALGNRGPHGFSEILYATTSAAGNNGSAFAGLSANSPFWNLTLAAAMFAGRFAMILPVLAIAGSMRGKKSVPPGPGTFPTTGPLFAALLTGVVIVVGALTFFPALCLGPVVEHFLAAAGRTF